MTYGVVSTVPGVELARLPAPLAVLGCVRNEMLRSGLSSMLRDFSNVSAEIYAKPGCPDVAEITRLVADRRFDVIMMSWTAEVERTAQIAGAGRRHDVRIVLLLQSADEWLPVERASLAVNGFMLESDLTRETLKNALLQLRHGDLPMPGPLARHLVAEVRRSRRQHVDRPRGPRPTLTPRESQVLHLLVEGSSNKQIARQLDISEHGAKRHVANVLAKLNCANRTCAAATALRLGLVHQT